MKKIQVFLSHKVTDEEVAQQIKVGIEKALPPLDIYVCEEITKGTLFNTDIWRALKSSRLSAVQYLADGIRLGIRTRNEVIKRFSGVLSKMSEERSLRDKEHGLYLGAGVGSLIKESLGAILEEASANGMGLDPNTARHLFSDPAQQSEYESIRKKGISIFNDLNATATAEDQAAMHNYERTEKLLVDLKAINERYLRLAIPQLNRLLAEETTTAPQALD